MSRKPTLAIVGATGAVGTVMLSILSEREDLWGEIRLVASARSAGRKLTVRGEQVIVQALSAEVFEGIDVAMFDVPDEVSLEWAPVAAAQGVIVVDKSGAFRMDPEVPLIIPEVNPHAADVRPKGIISNPNCTTTGFVMAMSPLHQEFNLKEAVVSSYQAASGAGQAGSDILHDQIAAIKGDRTIGTRSGDLRRVVGDETGPFPAPLALNVVPWAGSYRDGGWSSEEKKIRDESRKILELPDLKVAATCVRVPVITGHSAAVHAVFQNHVDVEAAREVLQAAPGVIVVDSPEEGEYPMPIDAVGTDPTWVGRVRVNEDNPRALELFLCCDNLRKGAALNAAQIAELVAQK